MLIYVYTTGEIFEMALFSSLRREQKEVIGLLQIGTFLEYFDLMPAIRGYLKELFTWKQREPFIPLDEPRNLNKERFRKL